MNDSYIYQGEKTMRKLLSVFIAGLLLANSAHSEDLTLSGYDAFQARQKTTCGTTEQGKVRYGIFQGRTYARVPGEKDTLLFNVLGINTRHCSVIEDDIRGAGFRSISREIMVYMDPETGEVIDTWMNPWTGQEIEVMHVANDPVNMRDYRYEKTADGEPESDFLAQRYGEMVATSFEVPLFYKNPLGGEYQPYVGGTYHAMEIFNTFYNARNLINTRTRSVGESFLGWSRVAKWLPWLEMGDRAGLMVFNANGFSTFDKRKIPADLMTILETRYPDYLEPPGLDDKRPNETSWTVFKKYVENKGGDAPTEAAH